MFTLQTVAAQGEGEGHSGAAQAGGFSLHAGLSIKPGQRAKLERLCRYVSRALPVALDLGGIRGAHAWWNDTLVRRLSERLRNGLADEFLQAAGVKGSPEWTAMEGVTKGQRPQVA